MADSQEDGPVAVTGANGFIGSWLVRTLLDDCYKTIHATVYPGSDATHLLSLPGASDGGVRVFEADILDPAALELAVGGCSGVFHVASPCTIEAVDDPERELILPAVQGTLNVLQAAKNSGTVRRVVLTSSVSAMVPNPGWPAGKVLDESSWTDLDYCKSVKAGYPVSKTRAERAAWEFAEKHGIDLISIQPAMCLGPLLQPGLNASSAVLLQLLQGSGGTQQYHWLWAVDVRDVSKAQILLFENRSAVGRYLCTNGIYKVGEIPDRVKKLFPEYPIQRFTVEIQPGFTACEDAAKRLISLGLVFTPLGDTIRDAVESLKSKGFLDHKNP